MNTENLQNLVNIGRLEKFSFEPSEIEEKMRHINNRISTASGLLKNNNDDESVDETVFAELYHSYRGICEAILWHCGYRLKEVQGKKAVIMESHVKQYI